MGHPRPNEHKYVGGAACLDFINTVSGRVSPSSLDDGPDYADQILEERLSTYGDLLVWAEGAEVLSPSATARLRALAGSTAVAADEVCHRALTLRESLYRLFKATIEGWTPPPSDMDVLNRELRNMRAAEELAYVESSLHWVWHTDESLVRPLWPLVRSAVDLLTSESSERVRQCPGEKCGWLFLDNKRGRPRRWCDMADCGNVAKVRRYRTRHGHRPDGSANSSPLK